MIADWKTARDAGDGQETSNRGRGFEEVLEEDRGNDECRTKQSQTSSH